MKKWKNKRVVLVRCMVLALLASFAVSCASSGGYYHKAPSGKFNCK